jgi:hypothetical protein
MKQCLNYLVIAIVAIIFWFSSFLESGFFDTLSSFFFLPTPLFFRLLFLSALSSPFFPSALSPFCPLFFPVLGGTHFFVRTGRLRMYFEVFFEVNFF